jgi:catechol 2,3-dioxygenase-like lactoylglutathione lyase family enzyme
LTMKTNPSSKAVFKLDSIVLDCRDAESLADFYAHGNCRRSQSGGEWASVINPEGTLYLYFQTEPDYVPPVWPAAPGRQMVHLDFAVNDLDAAVEHALSCGAVLADVQYLESFRVCLDPAGHPFCLCKHG